VLFDLFLSCYKIAGVKMLLDNHTDDTCTRMDSSNLNALHKVDLDLTVRQQKYIEPPEYEPIFGLYTGYFKWWARDFCPGEGSIFARESYIGDVVALMNASVDWRSFSLFRKGYLGDEENIKNNSEIQSQFVLPNLDGHGFPVSFAAV